MLTFAFNLNLKTNQRYPNTKVSKPLLFSGDPAAPKKIYFENISKMFAPALNIGQEKEKLG